MERHKKKPGNRQQVQDANILWDSSKSRIQSEFDFTGNKYILTQGFIGGTISGESTTLGREGSDYTAANPG